MITRREFLSLCMAGTATLSLSELLLPVVREAYARQKASKPPVIWIELGSCTGNSISLNNAVNPSLHQMIEEIIDLRYDWLLQAAQGDLALETLFHTVDNEAGRYWLVVEGAVMTADEGRWNYIYQKNGNLVTGIDALKELSAKAKHVIAVGGCACFGGPAAAYPNPGKAKGVWDIIKSPTVINIPGCPAHPDWMTGTFSHLALYGMPALDSYNRPLIFFGKTIHELCERRQQFEDGFFAEFPGQPGCLYKVGCKGPVTHADCPLRQWNHYVNWPVKAGAPCIGCASPQFPDGSMPFYQHLPDIKIGGIHANVRKLGAVLAAGSVAAVGTHLGVSIYKRRLHRHLTESTKPREALPPENQAQLEQEWEDLNKKVKALQSAEKRIGAIKKTKTPEGFGRFFRWLKGDDKEDKE